VAIPGKVFAQWLLNCSKSNNMVAV